MSASRNAYRALLRLKGDAVIHHSLGTAGYALCPDMGGRVFAEVGGLSMHRIDLGVVADPTRPFNNFGGGNFWPAPEGGKFGFNYEGDRWRVQESINLQPFTVVSNAPDHPIIEKTIMLTNRAETVVEAIMRREMVLADSCPACLEGYSFEGFLSYVTVDSFEVLNSVPVEDALIAAWTLEQFDASEHTVSFCAVENPRAAINFDYYEHPGERIAYHERGFVYRTDGTKAGQVGAKARAGASLIGFCNYSTGVVCVREDRSMSDGRYFNIADNDQPNGPYSAADNYSIYNSDTRMRAFELETVGSANVDGSFLKGSELVSATTFARFHETGDVEMFLAETLGPRAPE
ncbi:MAG: hypothetical protein JW888_03605 [Pirellulales bacterium]|nr:hypothetical protein [Pirellulales bacterium]